MTHYKPEENDILTVETINGKKIRVRVLLVREKNLTIDVVGVDGGPLPDERFSWRNIVAIESDDLIRQGMFQAFQTLVEAKDRRGLPNEPRMREPDFDREPDDEEEFDPENEYDAEGIAT